MTKEELKIMAEILLAVGNGEQVEFRLRGSQEWYDWRDMKSCSITDWNWGTYDYRIKTNPVFKPYETAEEVLEAIKQHGPYIKENNTYRYLKKFTVMENGEIVYSFSGWSSTSVKTWKEVYSLITWADGTPFGKLES